MEDIIVRHEIPDEKVPPLAFDTVYARSTWEQYLICCRKFNITYWRTPEYNGAPCVSETVCYLVALDGCA